MTSWIKSAVSKVRESGEALKQSETLRKLQEKTSSVVASAASQVGKVKQVVKGRAASAIELEAQLEQKAKNTRALPTLADLHKGWLLQLSTPSGIKEGDRELTFKEILLQSRALEFTVEIIASDPALKKAYQQPPLPDDKSSPASAFYELLTRTLACPPPLWTELLKVALGDTAAGENHVNWLVSVISATKSDWHEEGLYAERKELALKAEYLRQEIKQLESQCTVDALDEPHRKRVALSNDLLQTYQAVRLNLDEAQSLRKEVQSTRSSDLALIIEQVQAYMVTLQSAAQSSTDRHKHLEGELQQSHDSIQVQLQQMNEVRAQIDKEIEDLEKRKRELRMELDEVSRQLDESRSKQRLHMEKCDKQRRELDSLRGGFKGQIEAETAIISHAESEKFVIERTKELLEQAEATVQQSLGSQLEDLKRKHAQFEDNFRGLLAEHLRYAEAQLHSLTVKAEAGESSEAMVKALEAALQALGIFRSEYGGLLLPGSDAEVALERLEGQLADLQKKLLGPPGSAASTATAAAFQPPPRTDGAPEVSPPAELSHSPAPVATEVPSAAPAAPAPVAATAPLPAAVAPAPAPAPAAAAPAAAAPAAAASPVTAAGGPTATHQEAVPAVAPEATESTPPQPEAASHPARAVV